MDEERITVRIMGEEDECPSDGIDIATGKRLSPAQMNIKISAMLSWMVPEDERYRYVGNRINLMNGGQAYLESANYGSKIEYASPECLGPYALARAVSAGMLIMTKGVEAYLQNYGDIKFKVYKTNCGTDITSTNPIQTCGSHANYLTHRRVTFVELQKKLVPFLASRWGIIGNGWLAHWHGSLYFLFSQRGHAMEDIAIENSSTTTNAAKPFINTRDETLADKDRWRRLHDISPNHNLSEKQIVLKHGTMDLVLAAIEDGFLTPPPAPADPLCPDYTHASRRFNLDITASDSILTTDGTQWTWLMYQRHYLAECKRHLAAYPEALTDERARVLALWEHTLDLCAAQDFASIARYLDWAINLWHFLKPAVEKIGLNWQDLFSKIWGVAADAKIESTRGVFPLMNYLLHIMIAYSDINSARSLYGLLVRRGEIDRIFTDEEIENAANDPPPVRPLWRDRVIRWTHTHHPFNYIRTIYNIEWHKVSIKDTRQDDPNKYRYGSAENNDPYSAEFDTDAFERAVEREKEHTFSTASNCDEC